MLGRSKSDARGGRAARGIRATAARMPRRRMARSVVGITVLAVGALGGLTAASAAGNVGEGPYPWKYPASGNLQPGTGTTVNKTACTASTPQFASSYAPPCVPLIKGS